MEKQEYRVLGLMSGTSLDGLDLALCRFQNQAGKWTFSMEQTNTVAYPYELEAKLANAHAYSGEEIIQLDFELGRYMGSLCRAFLEGKEKPDFIASHGHTILHDPSRGYTLQIGKPEAIAAACRVDVVADFRSMDVALGGQGAPLVPIGDRLLFGEHTACINLGGFANISFEEGRKRIAYDIGPANMLLNSIVAKDRLRYDKDGLLAREGEVNNTMLQNLNSAEYFQRNPPKSLGKEWFEKHYTDVEKSSLRVSDLLATATEHIAMQIALALQGKDGSALFTGGGTHNTFLMERIAQNLAQRQSKVAIQIPDNQLIDFKEALVFAFLGVLRMRNEVNVLSSVTGSSKDHCAGILVSS